MRIGLQRNGVSPARSLRTSSGFTLLEVLISITIFAVISLGANKMLRTVIETHDRTQTNNNTFSDLSRAFAVLQRDFSHLVNRPVRSEYGETMPALMVATGEYQVEFSRSGWNNPANLPRSNLQRVAWELNADGELTRHFWLVMDRAEDSQPISQIILRDVEDFRINLLDEKGDTTDVWPDFDTSTTFPVAIELILSKKNLGELRKVYALVAAADTQALQSPSSGAGSNNGNGSGGTGNNQTGTSQSGTSQSGTDRGANTGLNTGTGVRQ